MIRLTAILMLSLCLQGWASTVVTPAQGAMDVLGRTLEAYAAQHEGQFPKKLKDLDPYMVRSLEKQLGGAALDESILLVNNRGIEMATPNKNEIFTGGEIIAVTASSIGEDRHEKDGRYVIWKTPKGRFRSSWLDESVVDAQFTKAGMNLPSGPFLQQPTTLDASPDDMMRKYAQENFKDPKNPTAEEVEKMKRDFAEKYSDKPASDSTPRPLQSTPILAASTPQPNATATPAVATEKPASSPAFPIVPLVIVAALIAGAAVFFLRRKS
jgi:hypothetical protein